MGLNRINIFLHSIIYLIIAFVVILLNDYTLSYKWRSSISIYIPALFIMSVLAYIFEEKLESKMRANKEKMPYTFLLIFFIFIFLLSTIFLNLTAIKVYFF
jgi:hypothetical protein